MKIKHKILALVWLILGSISGLILTYSMDGRVDVGNTLFDSIPLVLGPQIGILVAEARGMNPFWAAVVGFFLGFVILVLILAFFIWLLANYGV